MRRLLVVPAVLLGGAALPCTASAQIVKAPTGETSSLKVASSQTKTFKKHKLTFSATGAAKKSGSTLTLPYSLSRWDFGTREGDVAYYAKKTGFKLKRGKRTATAINPRLVLDTPKSGYISMLIANERIKFFTVSGAKAKAADSGNVQQTTGLHAQAHPGGRQLRQPRAAQEGPQALQPVRHARRADHPAGRGDPAARRRRRRPATAAARPAKATRPAARSPINPGLIDLLPGGGSVTPLLPADGIDLDGDGNADLTVLPLEGVDVDLDSETGTIKFGGGLILDLPGLGTRVELVNPEIVLGTDAGLYAHVNGVRVKVGDIDTDTLDLNVLDGTVTIKRPGREPSAAAC